MPKFSRNLASANEAFDRDALAHICAMHETDFGREFDLDLHVIERARKPEDYYFFKDNGSSVLAVAHLDTVVYHDQRAARFSESKYGPVVHSGALDDRLGAYIILDLLPKLGITYDILLTVGEESGASTAEFFDAPKDYDWIIEFDRGGTDVVMYQYEDAETIAAVRATGAQVGVGIFSDISYMEHLGSKGFNWGVGYQNYHSVNGFAYLNDTMEMVARYLKFHQQNYDVVSFPHEEADDWWTGYRKQPRSEVFDDEGNWWNHPSTYDQEYGGETIYFEDEYVQDPTIEELQAHLEAMDDDEYTYNHRQRAS